MSIAIRNNAAMITALIPTISSEPACCNAPMTSSSLSFFRQQVLQQECRLPPRAQLPAPLLSVLAPQRADLYRLPSSLLHNVALTGRRQRPGCQSLPRLDRLSYEFSASCSQSAHQPLALPQLLHVPCPLSFHLVRNGASSKL